MAQVSIDCSPGKAGSNAMRQKNFHLNKIQGDCMRFTSEELREMCYEELNEHIRLADVNRERYFAVKQKMLDEMANRNPLNNYKCGKCTHSKYELREMRVSSGLLSAIANWDVAKYSVVVCARCKFAEFYHGKLSDAEFVAEAVFGD